ncbi:AraD1 family protein [Pelagibacterium montanilacus]|uniref:AraD1 family protein n=1 Tax=Pelagibacterium montanilacus TaxID=2185280 RepID=UPI000F8C46B2|nr:AraD1 family protein [Pelagibacterium montanilacus]
MHLSQIVDAEGARHVVARKGQTAHTVPGISSVIELARAAIAAGRGLVDEIEGRGEGEAVDLGAAAAEGRVLAPVDHEDPAHLHLTGTGLTHLGSATTRDSMHAKARQAEADDAATDSMKMFQMGLAAGKSADGKCGVQPEWFYKGNGHALAAPGAPIPSPCFALDAGEEPEIAGIYLIADDGTPMRIGFALANEFSDHVTERQNYLYLAHSKLRYASAGPEILVGDLPAHVEGSSRIRRGGAVIWEKPFLSGEDNMSHTIANLEHHHFKYDIFRKPGDVHVHMFGTATLSFADGISTEDGDMFEIEAAQFGLPLKNPISVDGTTDPTALVMVKAL